MVRRGRKIVNVISDMIGKENVKKKKIHGSKKKVSKIKNIKVLKQ